MIRNIRHIQVKKIAYCPNLFKAIITYDSSTIDDNDTKEYRKYLEHQKDTCPKCEEMEKQRREIDKWER